MTNLKEDTLQDLSKMLSLKVFPKTRSARRKKMKSQAMKLVGTSRQPANTVLEVKPITPVSVLKELFELLEDYGPAWYTQENHNRAVEALAQLS